MPIATAWFEEDEAMVAALVVAAAAAGDVLLAGLIVLLEDKVEDDVEVAKLNVILVVGASIIVSAVAGPRPAIFVVVQHPS